MLNRARVLAGRTQQEIAAASKVSFARIRQFESGFSEPTLEEKEAILAALVTDLVRLDEPASNGNGDRGVIELVRSYRRLEPAAQTSLRQFLKAAAPRSTQRSDA